MSILLLGGTGRIGNLVLTGLLAREKTVKCIVRSKDRLKPGQADHHCITIVEADFASFSVDEMKNHLSGVSAVISCLGHNMTFSTIVFEELFVFKSARNVIDAINALQPSSPIKFVHLSTVGIMHPDGRDTQTRGWLERILLGSIYYLIQPLRDNQETVDYLHAMPPSNYVEWVALRPGDFADGPAGEYVLRSSSSIFDKDNVTNMPNTAAALVELSSNPELWSTWKNKMPIIVNKVATK
jgi:nucleoside-diphosphate-sugar epimerase